MGFLSTRRAQKEESRDFDAFQSIAAQVVDVMATAGVVLDLNNNVLRASPGAIQLGLVQNRKLIHSSLLKLVEKAKKTSGAVQKELFLETGLRRDKGVRPHAAHHVRREIRHRRDVLHAPQVRPQALPGVVHGTTDHRLKPPLL